MCNSLPPLFFPNPAEIFDNQRASLWGSKTEVGQTWVKRQVFITTDLFRLVVKSPLLKYEQTFNRGEKGGFATAALSSSDLEPWPLFHPQGDL